MRIDDITRENLTEIGTLDFQRKSNLLAGYALRAAGVVVFAALFAPAPGYLNPRGAMIANALAPFAVISLVGAVLIVLLPTAHLSWIFIPTVVNAAAAGGDFLGVAWLGKLPKETRLEDDGERLVAYLLGAEA
jgi:hypothetical protein